MTALTHEQWRTILLPVAREAVNRGDFDKELGSHKFDDFKREHHIGLIANYSATDMVLSGRTHMLDMDEVRAASGDAPAPLSPLCDASHSKPAAFRPVGSLPLSQERKRA